PPRCPPPLHDALPISAQAAAGRDPPRDERGGELRGALVVARAERVVEQREVPERVEDEAVPGEVAVEHAVLSADVGAGGREQVRDRKSTRLNSSHVKI